MREKLFHKNFHLGNLCEIAGENEREMKGNFCFHNHFQLHSTVYSYILLEGNLAKKLALSYITKDITKIWATRSRHAWAVERKLKIGHKIH